MEIKKIVHKIEKHYSYHGVYIKLRLVSGVDGGERFVFQVLLKPGTKVNLFFERASDIQMALQLKVFQPFRNGLTLCLVVSENNAMQNSLMRMLKSRRFYQSRYYLPIAIGYNMKQEMVFADLAKMPHVMYAGSTNSGKSVGLICLISSLIIRQPVRNVNLLIFDVGANTLGVFNDIPHLSYPIVKDDEEGTYVIQKLAEEMEKRILLDEDELRNLPAIVCVIDEYVSFINNINDKKKSKNIANNISNLIRRGRHAKIHMVISTQDPLLKNMKVDIGNITTRIAFRCAKYNNSIAILGESGAEKLSGNGTLLFKSDSYPHPIHIQGAYISDDEIVKLIGYVKAQDYEFINKFVIPEWSAEELPLQICENIDKVSGKNKELAKIIMWALGCDKISAKQIMGNFSIGNRAYEIVNQLCKLKLVAEQFAKQPRKVIPQCYEDLSPDVVNLLEQYGYEAAQIKEVLRAKGEQS